MLLRVAGPKIIDSPESSVTSKIDEWTAGNGRHGKASVGRGRYGSRRDYVCCSCRLVGSASPRSLHATCLETYSLHQVLRTRVCGSHGRSASISWQVTPPATWTKHNSTAVSGASNRHVLLLLGDAQDRTYVCSFLRIPRHSQTHRLCGKPLQTSHFAAGLPCQHRAY